MAASVAAQLAVQLENTRLYRTIDSLFRSYLAPTVVTRLLADPDQAALGGAVVEVTALFADLRGFTTYSERHEPEEVVTLLNRYYAAMIPCLLEHEGTIVNYAGDLVMAVFNAPTRQADHAMRAARAAVEMRDAVNDLTRGDPQLPTFGIGINTGPALVGNIGAELRDYTVIGDTVNVASRLEGAAAAGRDPARDPRREPNSGQTRSSRKPARSSSRGSRSRSTRGGSSRSGSRAPKSLPTVHAEDAEPRPVTLRSRRDDHSAYCIRRTDQLPRPRRLRRTRAAGHVRWDRLYRSDSLHTITAADAPMLRDLGVRTAIDFRSSDEIDRLGIGPLGEVSVRHVHCPTFDGVPHRRAAVRRARPRPSSTRT